MRNPRRWSWKWSAPRAWRGGRPATDRVGRPAAGGRHAVRQAVVYRSRDAPKPWWRRRERGLKTSSLCSAASRPRRGDDDGMLLNRSEVEVSDQVSGVLNVSATTSTHPPVTRALKASRTGGVAIRTCGAGTASRSSSRPGDEQRLMGREVISTSSCTDPATRERTGRYKALSRL